MVFSNYFSAVREEELYNVIKRKVWPYQKFILDDHDLWFGTNIEKTICKHMNIENKAEWWSKMNKVVLKKLTAVRNNVINMIKKQIECKSI